MARALWWTGVVWALGIVACDGHRPTHHGTETRADTPAPSPSAQPVVPPNILVVVLDTVRPDHLSSYGYHKPTTPQLDALAADGVRYLHAHSVAPWTLPAHMSLFTGLLPSEHGATWRAYSEPPDMPLGEMLSRRFTPSQPERLLGVLLKARGYRTLGFSANPWVGKRTGMAKGFDLFAEVWRPAYAEASFAAQFPKALTTIPEHDSTDTGRALLMFKAEISKSDRSRPFFAFFNLTDAHFPYAAPAPFTTRFGGDPSLLARMVPFKGDISEMAMLAGDRPVEFEALVPFYDGELAFADHMLGGLFSWLKAQGLYDDALIVVTSDHGEHLGEEGCFSHQLSMAEELLRIPLLIKFPQGRRAGTLDREPLVSLMDVYATVLRTAGARPPAGPSHALDLSSGQPLGRTRLLAEYFHSNAYLAQLKRLRPAFQSRPHRMAKHAVYDSAHKYRFDDLQLTRTSRRQKLPPQPEDIEGAAAWLRAYLQNLPGTPGLRTTEADVDPQMRDRLQSLGYVQP